MMESCVPPGFRFHPTDEELVGYYLRKKVGSHKIDLDVIREIDLYRIEPWDLQERCRMGYEEQSEWYFFSYKDKKYPTGTRTNRATMAGFWKATGRDKAVYDKTSSLIGMRKTLVFYKGRAPNGHKTDWIMHEYRLESDPHPHHLLLTNNINAPPPPPQEEGWVVCRAFKKRSNGQTKSMEGWDSSGYLYEETSGATSVVDPLEFITRHPHTQTNLLLSHHQDLMCKKESLEADHNNNSLMSTFMHSSSSFVDLPQLESPSLPLTKRPTSSSRALQVHDVSLISNNNNNNKEEDEMNNLITTTKRVTTDWRALDKFVASQLSQENQDHMRHVDEESTTSENNDHNQGVLSSFEMLLQSGGDEVNKLSSFLNGGSDCDIGICIFDK